jgi:Acetyltransferase (GNAT) domain
VNVTVSSALIKEGVASERSYRSILLEPDWVHQKYFGWRFMRLHPSCHVFSKKTALVNRYLIVSELSAEHLEALLDQTKILARPAFFNLKDLSTAYAQAERQRCVLGKQFLPAVGKQCVFARATFAVDLAQPLGVLWQNMKPDNRRVCRRAIDSGITVDQVSSVNDTLIAIFFQRCRKMASERAFAAPSEASIRAMLNDGNATMFIAKRGDEVCSMIIVYCAGSTSFYLYGVPGRHRSDGSGQLLQWRAIEQFKLRGMHWYDLGGLPSEDPSNGIYRFKQSIGGQRVDLGLEYVYAPWVLNAARRLHQWFRTSRSGAAHGGAGRHYE